MRGGGGDEGNLKTQGVALGYCFQAVGLFKNSFERKKVAPRGIQTN